MKIQVKSNEVITKRGTSRGTGRPYEMRVQVAFFEHEDERRKIEIMLEREQSAYAVGVYGIDDRSYTVDNFGNLQIARLVLTPLVAGRGSA